MRIDRHLSRSLSSQGRERQQRKKEELFEGDVQAMRTDLWKEVQGRMRV